MDPKKISMDRYDHAILDLLQRDATLNLSEIADKIKLSPTPTWRRIQRLEEAGIIRRRVALLDPVQLNVGVTVYVSIRTSQHNQEWFKRFNAAIASIPEVMEFYRMSGEVDYLLKVVVPDIAGYDAVYKKMISRIDLTDVSSSFAMEQLKYTTELPLEHAR
jgi:Lrp/AsnC family transcriptional regulator